MLPVFILGSATSILGKKIVSKPEAFEGSIDSVSRNLKRIARDVEVQVASLVLPADVSGPLAQSLVVLRTYRNSLLASRHCDIES